MTDYRQALTDAREPEHVEALLAVDALKALAAYDDHELELDLARVRRIRGCAALAQSLRSAIRSARRSAPVPLREQAPGASLRAWLVLAGCPSEWLPSGDAQIRSPFALAPGVVLDSEDCVVAAAPIAVVARYADPETERVSLDVVWCYHGRWHRQTVDRAVAVSRDGVLALAASGAPVDQTSAARVAQWLAACDLALDVPTGAAMARLGWLPDGSGFAPWSATVLAPGAGERDALRAYEPGGTWEGWLEGVWRRCAGHRAEIAILASLAAPLLHVCRTTGWTLDLGYRHGSGKTTTQYAAASCWTSRQGIVTWPRTWAAARSTVEFRTDVPAVLDDTKNLGPAGWALAKDLLYQVAGEQAQPLGSAGGGTRAVRILRTIVISSGETPIGDHLQDAQGAQFRILTLGDRPFPEGFGETVRAIQRASREHYGHAGRRVVEWLAANTSAWDRIRDRYEAHVARLASGNSDDGGRLAGRLALLYVAAEVAERALEIRPSTQVLDAFAAHVLGGTAERDVPREALRHVRSYLASRPAQVIGWGSPSERKQPYLAHQTLGGPLELIVEPLDRILAEGGYVAAEIRRQWADAGWLDRVTKGRDGRSRTSALRSIEGRNTRVVPIRLDVLDGEDRE